MEKKRYILHTVICVVLLCVIWGGYFLVNHKILIDKHQQITLYNDDFSWVYQVDSVETNGKGIALSGFAFELNKDATQQAFEIVLHDIESGENYFPEMEYMERNDVNKYFECEYDYLCSGFKATIKSKKLDVENNSYEVLLRIAESEKAYQTGTYISKGEVVYVNPLEFEKLDVAGTDLEEVVEEGVLRVYRPDYGMYVYQYEDEFYWIADDRYSFEDDKTTYVQYHLWTSQIEKLPQHRLSNSLLWDNRGFDFEKCELVLRTGSHYRVAKSKIPNEYSLIKIQTGYYAGETWEWLQIFRPLYAFE